MGVVGVRRRFQAEVVCLPAVGPALAIPRNPPPRQQLLHARRMLAGPSCPSAGWGLDPARRWTVELATGRELLGLAVIVLALLTVMWVLARTRRSEG